MCGVVAVRDRRKSPAWFGLLRKHAELAVQDVTYLATMKENCKAGTMINKKWAVHPHPAHRSNIIHILH